MVPKIMTCSCLKIFIKILFYVDHLCCLYYLSEVDFCLFICEIHKKNKETKRCSKSGTTLNWPILSKTLTVYRFKLNLMIRILFVFALKSSFFCGQQADHRLIVLLKWTTYETKGAESNWYRLLLCVYIPSCELNWYKTL